MNEVKSNQNVGYELLTKTIYEALIKQSELKTVDIKHNQIAIGRSGAEHQIDVLWEFEIANVIYRTFIECKNFSNTVKIGHIRSFFGVLHDVGNVNGIVVTKVGYQKGAKTFADYYNIRLVEIREPTDEDWKDRVKVIDIQMTVPHCIISNWKPIFDDEQIKELLKSQNLNKLDFKLFGLENEIYLYSQDGSMLFSFQDLKDILEGDSFEECQKIRKCHKFDKPVFLKSDIGLIKVKEIEYDYEYHVKIIETKIDGAETVKAIIKDIKSGKVKLYDRDGNIREMD